MGKSGRIFFLKPGITGSQTTAKKACGCSSQKNRVPCGNGSLTGTPPQIGSMCYWQGVAYSPGSMRCVRGDHSFPTWYLCKDNGTWYDTTHMCQ